ncbi:uncharacterized protein N7443_003599 [Penicillium atrosanguineum]|uniref:uncharacterized protein n=1 Tax=Penicillium atrosanguineum TaxID=1132637 RepID=UPI0023A51710|nr:uncharacterized protein N7443_003599 [Penicillium atrosanguineum]KAJ5303939.1 hypothetical protein N7443_003599 [Penicillium atrosanguineum]
MGEPEDVMDEQPDHGNWCDIQLSQADLLQGNFRQDTLEEELTQFTNDVTTINDTNNTPEPRLEDLDPESPEYQKLITLKYNRMQAVPVRSSPPAITTDAPTIEDPTDDVWHEASERIVVSDGYVPQGQEGLSGGHRHSVGAVEKRTATYNPPTSDCRIPASIPSKGNPALSLFNQLVNYERADDIEHSSDHFPIRTVLDIETPVLIQQKRRNWNATDDNKLIQKIKEDSKAKDLSQAGPPQIEAQYQKLLDTVQSAIEASTPWAKPSTWSNPDFDNECKAAVKEMRYSEARNKKTRLVKRALSRAHRRRVQQVIEDGPQGMWRLAKWARNRNGAYEKGLTPSLKIQGLQSPGQLAETVEQKANAFRAAFFPQPPLADLSDTVKRGKSYYQLAKSYRPVAWLNTLGKFPEAVVARRISYAVETMGLLPKTHLGGRRGISTDHAIHNMIDRIKMAWGKGKPVVSLLMLDVSGAYDNVSHDRLLHNLRKRRLGQIAPWVKTFLSNQSTRIHLTKNYGNGVTSNGWVDDVCFMAKGDSERETTKKLRMAYRKADQWARTHASVFDPKKYALVHFVNTREIDP